MVHVIILWSTRIKSDRFLVLNILFKIQFEEKITKPMYGPFLDMDAQNDAAKTQSTWFLCFCSLMYFTWMVRYWDHIMSAINFWIIFRNFIWRLSYTLMVDGWQPMVETVIQYDSLVFRTRTNFVFNKIPQWFYLRLLTIMHPLTVLLTCKYRSECQSCKSTVLFHFLPPWSFMWK